MLHTSSTAQMNGEMPYYQSWNPAQRRPKPPVSRLDEAKRRYVLSTLKDMPDGGMNAEVIPKKSRR